MLCLTCQNIFRGSCPHNTSRHHSYIHQLEQAAFEKCHICRVIWDDISDRPPIRTKETLAPYLQEKVAISPISQCTIRHRSIRSRDNIYNISELSLVVDKNGIGNGGRVFTFCLQPMRKVGIHLRTEGPSDSSSWSSSMVSVKKWLDGCLESHERCRSAQWSALVNNLPTRLIQIGQLSVQKIRLLLHPKQEGTNIRYATLSHCWGTSHVQRLTSTTLRSLQEGIAISELGQTFQDAIFAARSLGIQFIWIDSLCILQDSQEDWQREAPHMSSVYRYAILNIAASIAADNKAGCFPDRDTSLIKPCTVQTAWVDCQNENYNLYHDSFWRHAFDDMPLMKRAWVVQELLMAPRILHLTGKQLFWECYDLEACESYPDGIPPNMEQRSILRETRWGAFSYAQRRSVAVDGGSKRSSKDDLWNLWVGIVETYTACKLTYTSDKLVALSGVAKLMEQALDDQYCAGMWRKNLVTQLFWRCSCAEQKLRLRPDPYRAPSWSWLSLDGLISPAWYDERSYTETEMLVNIIDCEIESTTGDATSVITGGTLRLSGWVATIQLLPDPQDESSVFFNGTWWKRHPGFHFNLDSKVPTLKLHCLPLFVDTHQSPRWNVSCLLLGPTGVLKGQFKRLGIMDIFAGALGIEDWTDFRDVKNVDWLEYEALDGNGQYIISVI